MGGIALRGLVAVAALPPPPEPRAASTDGLSGAVLLAALGVVIVGALVVAVRLRPRWRARKPPFPTVSPPLYRFEHWLNGEATILAYGTEPTAQAGALLTHAARLQARHIRGAVVLIEHASDAIITVHPV